MSSFLSALRQQPVGLQLIALVGIIFLAGGLITSLGLGALGSWFGYGPMELQDMLTNTDLMKDPTYLRLLQFINSVAIFIVPSLLFNQIFRAHPANTMGFRASADILLFILAVTLILSLGPFIDAVSWWNEQWSLPSFMSGLDDGFRTLQEQTQQTIRTISKMDSPSDLLLNLLVMAALPAIGEEMLFRGTVQRLLGEWSRNAHVGIWLSSLIFALLHTQVYVLLSLTILGAILGYLRYWSGNIWVPILVHFLNNATIVLTLYFGGIDESRINQGEFPGWPLFLGSMFIGSLLMWVFWKRAQKNPDSIRLD
ncbi:MAG: CPBP family intramembrane metalloprotease [Bacteroidota bacterium]|nr:CPBP family intramembrane metalloprotease [Bacteroidota bacterium]MDX5429102.1 CPBP family intramembrane metalloprotease [Bacteroidota bacterium]MDX5448817.1 CPBP family intramembrane metalloprotease [Bacteroidota bacterium]MDX5506751.1 CPBP family intramembrane metalloprotease [Bacteroidota bacterium]